MSRSTKRPKFSGVLAQPIVLPAAELHKRLSAARVRAEMARRERHLEEQKKARIPALFAHYGIKPTAPDSLKRLVVRMAGEFVPGFQLAATPPKKRGRKLKWGPVQMLNLVEQVRDVLQSRRAPSAFSACSRLVQHGQPYAWLGNKKETLYRQYTRAKAMFDHDDSDGICLEPLGNN